MTGCKRCSSAADLRTCAQCFLTLCGTHILERICPHAADGAHQPAACSLCQKPLLDNDAVRIDGRCDACLTNYNKRRGGTMITIDIKLRPAGRPASQSELLGRLEIANDETGDETTGHYTAVAFRQPGVGPRRPATRVVRVENFPRKDLDAWSLLRRALEALDREDGLE